MSPSRKRPLATFLATTIAIVSVAYLISWASDDVQPHPKRTQDRPGAPTIIVTDEDRDDDSWSMVKQAQSPNSSEEECQVQTASTVSPAEPADVSTNAIESETFGDQMEVLDTGDGSMGPLDGNSSDTDVLLHHVSTGTHISEDTAVSGAMDGSKALDSVELAQMVASQPNEAVTDSLNEGIKQSDEQVEVSPSIEGIKKRVTLINCADNDAHFIKPVDMEQSKVDEIVMHRSSKVDELVALIAIWVACIGLPILFLKPSLLF
ncbi:hypothetical protein BC830DRAFT_1168365 [Chytriomyces sp. MP71]|nr:hypothetical protein BC830DRAFT_1168365 [Chytriomyces sp. MP71]